MTKIWNCQSDARSYWLHIPFPIHTKKSKTLVGNFKVCIIEQSIFFTTFVFLVVVDYFILALQSTLNIVSIEHLFIIELKFVVLILFCLRLTLSIHSARFSCWWVFSFTDLDFWVKFLSRLFFKGLEFQSLYLLISLL